MLSHQHLIKYFFKRELSEIYMSVALRDLALSMSGIFVPIYLFVDLKYSLNQVLMFFLIFALALIVGSFMAAKFTSKYGIKHGILASMFGFVTYTIILATLPYHGWYFIPAIIAGISNSFYWLNFHADFAKFSDNKNQGKEVSTWFITAYVSILIGPILGSVIITYLGFISLFVIVVLILLLSAVPLFLSSEVYEPVKFSFKYIFKKSHLKDSYMYITYGLKTMIFQVVFPLYIFLILGKYISLGAIASLTSLGSIIVGFFVGRLSKNEKREKLMFKYGSLFNSVGIFFMMIVKTFIQIAVVNVYLAISLIFVEIPHYSLVYEKARKEKNLIEYLTYREIMIGFGRLMGAVIILIVGKLSYGFIISGIATMSWVLL